MWWLIVLAAILLIGLIPVGICGVYDSAGPRAWLMIGPLRYMIYPKKRGKKVRKKKKASHSGGKKSVSQSNVISSKYL